MTTETVANVTTETANVVEETKQETQVNEKIESKETINDRILKESKEWKAKYQELDKKLKLDTESKLKEQNQYKTLWESERKNNETLAKKILEDKKMSALTKAAQQLSCRSIDDAIKLGNTSFLTYDAEADEFSGADAFMEDLKKSKPYLFEEKQVAKLPTMRAGGSGKEVPFSELTFAEKEKFLKQQLQDTLK
jgi:hypothetical protein